MFSDVGTKSVKHIIRITLLIKVRRLVIKIFVIEVPPLANDPDIADGIDAIYPLSLPQNLKAIDRHHGSCDR
jgi:hypothetical protein